MKDKDTIKKSYYNKLRSNAGESISETLVALLISALALVMLAGAISAASRIVTRSRSKMKEYYDNNEKLVNLSVESSAGRVIITEDTSDPASGDDQSAIASIPILYYENGTFTNKTVIAYRKSTEN